MPGYTTYRAPTEYAVTSDTPVRIASRQDAPIRVINTGVLGAVWLSENAGIKAGQGTPLNPGTSFTWLRETEIFAIADIGTVKIIVTEEVDDWQPDPAAIAAAVLNAGVLVIDDPELIFDSTRIGVANNISATPNIDVSRFQSVLIELEILQLGSTGGRNAAQVSFDDDGNLNIVQSYTVQFEEVGQQWIAEVPATASSVEIVWYDDTHVHVTMLGSHRAVPKLRQRISRTTRFSANGEIPLNILFETDGVDIAPGGNKEYVLPPWHGEVEMHIRTFTAGGLANPPHLQYRQRSSLDGAFKIFRQVDLTAFGNNFALNERFAIAGAALTLRLTNPGGNASNIEAHTIHITPHTGAAV